MNGKQAFDNKNAPQDAQKSEKLNKQEKIL
jgi:hypothetical protein